jgi:hypothetical protein
MKKSIALVALAFGVTGAFAQDLTSKKGEPFLPEAGDYAVGIDATPFLNYVGNFFGKSAANTAPTWNFLTSNLTITGKKFKDANTAYRASIRLGFGGNTQKNQIGDATATTAPTYPTLPSYKEDKFKSSNTNIGLSVGLEKRRGKTRLQGIYGAEFGLGIATSGQKYTYGNSITPTSSTPSVPVSAATTTNFGTNLTTDTYGNAARVTRRKNGMTFNVGVRAFVGAEYFVAPKVSIGGEFGWGLGYSMTGKSKTTVESVGTDAGGNSVVGTQETVGNKSSSFTLDTDNKNSFFGPSGTIRLNLHF